MSTMGPVSGEPLPERSAAGERGTRRRRRAEARSRLLRAALGLSAGAHFHDLTVERIASAAGISRSAFYLHYRDKHELLLDALERISGELEAAAAGWFGGPGPPAEQVRAGVERLVSLYAENAELLRLLTEVSTYDDEVRVAWLAALERLIEAGADHVRAEQRAGLIPAAVTARDTVESLVWMTERCCYEHLGRGDRSAEELAAVQAPIWMAALYPGVIPSDQLRPGSPESGGPWGDPDLRWGTGAA